MTMTFKEAVKYFEEIHIDNIIEKKLPHLRLYSPLNKTSELFEEYIIKEDEKVYCVTLDGSQHTYLEMWWFEDKVHRDGCRPALLHVHLSSFISEKSYAINGVLYDDEHGYKEALIKQRFEQNK